MPVMIVLNANIMTHGSLFSGIGGAELAASWMGWNNLFHCEIDPFCQRILNYWFPESKSYGDITKTDFRQWRGKVDVLTGGFPCFVAGTRIITEDGIKPIELISIGDMILTKNGRYMPCNAIMNKTTEEVIEIKPQGLYEPIMTTKNHPFWIKQKGLNIPTWINASDIKKGDKIAYRCIEGNLRLKTKEYWYMVGRYLGDGWILDGKRKSKIEKGHRGSRINSFNHKVVICCNKSEDAELDLIIKNAGFNYTLSNGASVDKFIICNQNLVNELKSFGRYAHGKKLSKECFQLEYSRKKALFDGWLSADGYIDKNGSYKATTVSSNLAMDMSIIARDVYKCPISISKKTVNRKCVIGNRVVNERPQYCLTVSNNHKYGYYENGFVWCLVKNVFKEKKSIQVYNIGVLEDESYTANGIAVHNCQPFSLAGKRQGTTDNRYLWPEMLRAIREIQPAWVVGENVGGIVSMVQPGTEIEMGCEASLFEEDYYTEEEQTYVIETICEDFEDEGYSVQPILIPACAVGAPHRRDRVWFVAHRNSDRRRVWKNEQEFVEKRKGKTNNSISSQNGIITNTNGNGRLLPRESFGTKEKKCIISQQSERRFSTERTNGLFGFQQSIAYPNRNRFFGCDGKDEKQSSKRWVYVLDDAQQVGFERGKYTKNDWSNFPTQSPVCDRNDGLSHRLVDISFPKWRNESIKAYGNAWVPQVAYEIFSVIDELNEINNRE